MSKTPRCAECGMPAAPTNYHPHLYCVLWRAYKPTHPRSVLESTLSDPGVLVTLPAVAELADLIREARRVLDLDCRDPDDYLPLPERWRSILDNQEDTEQT